MTPARRALDGAVPVGTCSVQLDRSPTERDEADDPVRDIERQQGAAVPALQATRGEAVRREAVQGDERRQMPDEHVRTDDDAAGQEGDAQLPGDREDDAPD